MAEGLIDAVQAIAGTREGLVPLDNEGLTAEGLEERLAELVDDRPTVLFVDMPSGSCAHAARRLHRRVSSVAIVCGVNLPLLLDFVFHRELPLPELIDRLRSHVGISIEHGPDADRPVSGR
jgi:mannose/fructose-specific phosphotransferase system component IIA